MEFVSVLRISVAGAIMPSLHFETGDVDMEHAEMKIWEVEVKTTVYGDFFVKARSPEKAKELVTNLFRTAHQPRDWSTSPYYQVTVIGEAEPGAIENGEHIDAVEEVNDP